MRTIAQRGGITERKAWRDKREGGCVIYINKVVTNLGGTRFGRQEQVFKLPYLLISAGEDGRSDCYVLLFQRVAMGVQTAMSSRFKGEKRAFSPPTP